MIEKTESEIKREIMQYLELLPRSMFWIQQAGKIPGRINKSRYLLNGISDILGIYQGKFVAIEVKRPKGVVSNEQEIFLRNVADCGGIAFVARSLEDVILGLQKI